ncbi:MAG: hypothetical protein IJ973_04355 [Christensenellaceae bacterium]|nr:hypothetical protein [Christensenellaceae bacterium]
MLKRTFILILAFLLISSFSCSIKETEEQPSISLETPAPTVQPTQEASIDYSSTDWDDWGHPFDKGYSGDVTISPTVLHFLKEGGTERKKIYINVWYSDPIFSYKGLTFEDINILPAYGYRTNYSFYNNWEKELSEEYPDYYAWVAETQGEELLQDLRFIEEWMREKKKWEKELEKEKPLREWREDMIAHEYKRIDALYGLEYDAEHDEYFGYFTAEELLNFRFRSCTGYVIRTDPSESILDNESLILMDP